MANIKMWVDGSAEPNPGPGGWGVVAILDNGEEKRVGDSLEHVTNNQAELVACLKGIQLFTRPGDKVEIYSDSKYVIGVASKGWKAKKNRDLIEAVIKESMGRSITYVYVPSEANPADPLSRMWL